MSKASRTCGSSDHRDIINVQICKIRLLFDLLNSGCNKERGLDISSEGIKGLCWILCEIDDDLTEIVKT